MSHGAGAVPVQAEADAVRVVLVGVDGSEGSRKALAWALEEAELHDARLRVLHVLADGAGGPDALRAAGRSMLDEALADARAQVTALPREVITEVVLAEGGGTAATLIALASEADLLVLGARGLGGFAGLLLGSVSEQCATHAPCPVAVIPTRDAPPGAWHPAGAERHIALRDGTPVLLRPIRPSDSDKLRKGLQELSSESRYLRFHMPVVELSDEQLTYLTEVDQRDHIAWVAVDPTAPDERGYGVARCVRVKGEPTVAEAAVTVADAYQGRGLGTALLHLIAERAAANGITTLRNYVLAENAAMLEVLDGLGATRTLVEPGVWEVDVRLPDPPAGTAGSAAARVLREFANGLLLWRGLSSLRRISDA